MPGVLFDFMLSYMPTLYAVKAKLIFSSDTLIADLIPKCSKFISCNMSSQFSKRLA